MQPDRASSSTIIRYPQKTLACTATILALLVAAPGAWAQNKPEFATIRKTELAAIDRGNVEKWIGQQVQQLFTVQDNQVLKTTGQDLVSTITVHVRASDATAKFKQETAGILADAFVSQYGQAPQDRRPLSAVYVLMALNQVAQPTPKMIEAFTLGLSDPASGARTMAISGLLGIRGQLNQQQLTALLPVLQKAGIAETNSVALSRIYRFLAMPAEAQVDTVPVVTAILQGRLTNIEQKKAKPLGADAEAIQWLGTKAAGMNAQAQDRLVLLSARLLANAVYAYTNKPLESEIVPLEKVVMGSEKVLKDVVRRRASGAQAADVTSAMLAGGSGQADGMRLALNKWIGNAQQAGTLNGAPFNLERGLKIALPEGAAAPQAAANPADNAASGN